MLLHLVKKDFLIVKKYVLIMLVAAIAIPPVMLWRAPEYGGVMGFILSVSILFLLKHNAPVVDHNQHIRNFIEVGSDMRGEEYPFAALGRRKYSVCSRTR